MYQHVGGESQEGDGGASAWDSAPLDYLQSAPQQPPKPDEEAAEEPEEHMDTTQSSNPQVRRTVSFFSTKFSEVVTYVMSTGAHGV